MRPHPLTRVRVFAVLQVPIRSPLTHTAVPMSVPAVAAALPPQPPADASSCDPMLSPALRALCPLVRVPLWSAPMGSMAGGALAAAVGEAGGCGMIGAGAGRNLPWLQEQIKIVHDRLQASKEPEATTGAAESSSHIRASAAAGGFMWGIGFLTFCLDVAPAALDLALAARPLPDVVFLSFPRADSDGGRAYADRAHAAGVRCVLVQLQTVAEAVSASEWADGIVAQGDEAGGHGASTLSTLELVRQVREAISKKPNSKTKIVLAAGGIGCGADLANALRAGADGALLGSRFLACAELISSNKSMAVAARGSETVRSALPDALACPGVFPPPINGRAWLSPWMRQYVARESELGPDAAAAFKSGPDGGNVLWAGPAVEHVRTLNEPAADIVRNIAEEATNKLRETKE